MPKQSPGKSYAIRKLKTILRFLEEDPYGNINVQLEKAIAIFDKFPELREDYEEQLSAAIRRAEHLRNGGADRSS